MPFPVLDLKMESSCENIQQNRKLRKQDMDGTKNKILMG